MKFNALRFPLIIILMFLGTMAVAQKSATKEADVMFKAHRYYEAVSLYKTSYTKRAFCYWKKVDFV